MESERGWVAVGDMARNEDGGEGREEGEVGEEGCCALLAWRKACGRCGRDVVVVDGGRDVRVEVEERSRRERGGLCVVLA